MWDCCFQTKPSPRGPSLMATTRLQIGPADHGRRMTLGEFREAEEEPGSCYELARGSLEMNDIPKAPHRRVASCLFQLAAAYPRDRPGVIDYSGGGTEVRVWKPGMDLGRQGSGGHRGPSGCSRGMSPSRARR